MIFEILTNINKTDTLLNLLIFTIYVQYFSYADFLKVFQLNALQKLLRCAGINYN